MDFNNLNQGLESTQEFSMGDGSAMEFFLNGDASKIEKIEEGDDQKKDQKKTPPVKKETPPQKEEKKEEETEEEEEDIDILEELDQDEDADNEDEDEDKKKEEDGDESQFEAMAKELINIGVFTESEEFPELPKTAEEFAARFQAEKQLGATTWLQSFLTSKGQEAYDMFDAVIVNGVDPKEYLSTFQQVQDLSGMDIEQEATQEHVFREYYKRLNWSAEKIEAKLQKVKDYGDLEDESKEMYDKLIEQDEQKLQELTEKKKAENARKQEEEKAYRTSVNKVLSEALKQKELKGFPITEKMARDAMDFLTTPKYKLPNGELLTEWDKFYMESKRPDGVEARAMMALLHLSGYDLSKVEKKAVSKETNQLFSSIKKTSVKSKTQKVEQSGDYFKNL